MTPEEQWSDRPEHQGEDLDDPIERIVHRVYPDMDDHSQQRVVLRLLLEKLIDEERERNKRIANEAKIEGEGHERWNAACAHIFHTISREDE